MSDNVAIQEQPTVRKRTRAPEITSLDDTPPEKPKSELAAVMAQVQKVHGPMVMRKARDRARFIHLPTRVFTLDMALHGGVPQSLVSMPYGWESSGKTTLCMRIIASAQQKYPDEQAVLIDAEGTYDPMWGAVHGIDNDRLLLVQPQTGEQAVDIADAVLRARDTSIVVLDSIPALVPLKELEKSAEDDIVALQARLTGRFIRKANQALIDERKRDHFPCLLLVNQWRNKIQMMGDPRSLPGGNALKFFVSVRFEVFNKETMGKDSFDIETVDYNEHSFKITKNKVGNGIRNGEFKMIRNPAHELGPGFIDEAKEVMTFARKFGLLTGGGSAWYLDGYMGLEDASKPMRFGKLQEVADCLYSDLEYFENLKRRMIAMQRVNCGLEGEGWY